MITPRFSLSQDEKSLTINVRAPYCCLRELEVEVEDNSFLFLCKPYYLRLHLPGNVDEEPTSSAFDSDTGEFSFSYKKATIGEHFEDLGLITKFLVSKVVTCEDGERSITVLTSGSTELTKAEPKDLSHGFGFALQGHKDFIKISSEFMEVFEIDPGDVSLPDRRKLRLQYEQEKFDASHYLGDFIEDEDIDEIIAQNTPWNDLDETLVQFDSKDLDFLKDLSNIEYDLTHEQTKYVFNGLVDILYAYCYDRRTTFYEENSESGWTIIKLAASLSWLDAFDSPKEVLISGFRRSVIYPLYRHFKLNKKVLDDLKKLLQLGEKYIIKCLLEIYQIFLKGDCCRYILNNLFIKDYVTYIMKWEKAAWLKFVNEVLCVEIEKKDLGLHLTELEEDFTLEKLAEMTIDDDSDDSADDTSTDSDDSTSTENDSSDTRTSIS